jgi:glycosyltransferase involved in cell wall biosynthesis
MVSPQNIELLASQIVDLLRNPLQQQQLGAAARKLIEDDFSSARMTADYLSIYRDAASHKNHGN